MRKSSVPSNYYVNNKQLYEAMTAYIAKVREAAANGQERPRVPEYIGKCICLIGERLATKPNFRKYSYTEEMIGDGNLACIRYIHNFNPEKSSNPFAWFSQIHVHAFVNRLNGEQKQQYVRARLMKDVVSFLAEVPATSAAVSKEGTVDITDSDPVNNVIESFERRMSDRKERAARNAKEKQIDAENENLAADDPFESE